jgi:hypothetical protein
MLRFPANDHGGGPMGTSLAWAQFAGPARSGTPQARCVSAFAHVGV